MKKTSVYLTALEVERLATLSRAEGRPQAEIVRDAIASYRQRPSPDRDFLLFDSGSGDGISVADLPEEELMRGFGED